MLLKAFLIFWNSVHIYVPKINCYLMLLPLHQITLLSPHDVYYWFSIAMSNFIQKTEHSFLSLSIRHVLQLICNFFLFELQQSSAHKKVLTKDKCNYKSEGENLGKFLGSGFYSKVPVGVGMV